VMKVVAHGHTPKNVDDTAAICKPCCPISADRRRSPSLPCHGGPTRI
jgi:hypothetical protein